MNNVNLKEKNGDNSKLELSEKIEKRIKERKGYQHHFYPFL